MDVIDILMAKMLSGGPSGGGGSVTVDSALSTTSENPVQNKVVKAALDQKADASAIPAMATQANMSDWTSGKTVDAAALKTDFQNALQALSGKQDTLTAGQNVTISGNTISAYVDSAEIASNVTNWLDTNVDPVGSAVVVDSSLSVQGAAADAKATGDALSEKIDMPSGGQSGQALLSDGANGAYWGQAQGGGSGLTDSIKSALLACFRNVAWINDQGETFYQALYDALYPPANLLSISARFNQGTAKIYNTDSLDALKPYLTVTAHYDNQTSGTITNYALSGLLSVGTSTITASYGGKSATFTVTVSEKGAEIERTGNDLYIINAGASKVGSTLVFS